MILKKIIRNLIFSTSIILFLVMSALVIFCNTQFGLTTVLNKVLPQAGYKVSYEHLQGTLHKGIKVDNLHFEDKEGLIIDAKDLRLSISLLALFEPELYIKRLSADKLTIKILTKEKFSDSEKTNNNKENLKQPSISHTLQPKAINNQSIKMLPMYVKHLRVNTLTIEHYKQEIENQTLNTQNKNSQPSHNTAKKDNHPISITGFNQTSIKNEFFNINIDGSKRFGHWRINQGTFETQNGKASIIGNIYWRPFVRLDLKLDLSDIQYQNFSQQLKISGKALIQGELKTDELIDIRVIDIKGTLNNKVIEGHLDAKFNYPYLTELNTKLILGDNILLANTSFKSDASGHFLIDFKNLAQINPSWKGRLKSQMAISQSSESISINGTTTIDNLKIKEYELKEFFIETAGPIEKLNIHVKGNLNEQKFESTLETEYLKEERNLNITFSKTMLKFSNLTFKDLQTWKQDQTSRLSVGWKPHSSNIYNTNTKVNKNKIPNIIASLDSLCFKGNKGSICTKGAYHDVKNFEFDLKAKNVDLENIDPLISEYLELKGKSDIDIEVLNKDGEWSGKIKQNCSLGRLSMLDLDGVKHHWPLQNAILTADIDKNIKINAKLNLAKTNDFEFKGNIPLNTSLPLLEQKIEGTLDLKAKDFSFLSFFWPELISLKGQGNAQLAIQGNLGKPKFSGKGSFKDLSWPMMQLGSSVYLDTLQYEGIGENTLKVKGSGKIGQGPVQLTGQIKLENNLPIIDFQLKGKDVKLINTPEYDIEINPDISYQLKGKISKLSGDLQITKARIEPKDLSNTLSSSKDIIIVNSKDNFKNDLKPYKPIHFETDLKVSLLGQKIKFNGYGLNAKLGGQFKILRGEDGLTKANGKLKVLEGKYSAYSRNFDIEQGELIYTQSPIDNPYLDIKAQRIIEKEDSSIDLNNKDIIVGVQMKGEANAPVLNLYSIPSMRDADIISYIILGRPQNQSMQSQGEEAFQALSEMSKFMTKSNSSLVDSMAKNLKLDEIEFKKDAKMNSTLEQSTSGETTGDKSYGKDLQNALIGTRLVVGKKIGEQLYFNYSIGLTDALSSIKLKYLLNKHFRIEADASIRGTGADFVYSLEK